MHQAVPIRAVRSACASAFLSAVGLLAALLPAPAAAENPSPLPEWVYSAGIPLRERFLDDPPKWDTSVGASVEVLPKFDGSNEYRVLPGPMVDARYGHQAFISLGEGLGWNIFHDKNYRIGTALTYDLGRSRHTSYYTQRLDSVRPAPELKFFADWVLFPVILRVDVRRSIGGYNGWAGDFSAYMPVAGSERFFVFVGPSVSLGDRRYMQRYFGVTPDEAQRSGYPAYDASGGLKTYNFGVNATYYIVKGKWFVNGIAAVDHLVGAAANSPTTQERNQVIVGLTFAYEWQSKKNWSER